MPINMTEAAQEELCYQLERCTFALTTMLNDVNNLFANLSNDSVEWPEDASFMLEEMADAIGDADDKVCEIVGQIRQYID